MKALKAGDVVTVTKLDRLGRSTRELLDLIDRIGKAGAAFRSLGDPLWDTSNAQGRLLSTLLAGIAEFERELIRERTGEGRKRAMAAGVKFGRKRKLSDYQRKEAICTDEGGLAVFELIRRARDGGNAVLCVFDLIEFEGEDLRRAPIEHRKHKLAKLVRTPHPGIVLNEHYEGDGEIVFAHACKLGCEGIVSKRLGSPYRSGRSAYWVEVKNPKAPAVKREAEEDWGR